MFDEENFDWTDRSIEVASPRIDVTFRTKDRFYLGDPSDSTQIRDPQNYAPLVPPGSGEAISIADLVGNVEPLALYYRDIVERSSAKAEKFRQFDHYFWMRLWINWEGGSLQCHWFDTWSEMKGLLGWLARAKNGQDWYDVHQGWELQAFRRESWFFLREGDGSGNEQLNIKLSREQFLQSIKAVEDDVVGVIGELSAYLGADVWTKNVWIRPRKVTFGTATWKPH